MSEFVVLLERLIGWSELWGMGTDSHSAEKLADTRTALVEYVTGLEEEVERLREEIEAIGKAHHKDIVILGGLYLENKSLKAEIARLREAAQGECLWHLEDDDAGLWESSCGASWVYFDGGPEENEMKFCPVCGKNLRVLPSQPPEVE